MSAHDKWLLIPASWGGRVKSGDGILGRDGAARFDVRQRCHQARLLNDFIECEKGRSQMHPARAVKCSGDDFSTLLVCCACSLRCFWMF